MTRFEAYEEKLQARRQAERETAIDGALWTSLQTRTREEVLAELFNGLTFIAGFSDILTANGGKELVF